MGQNMGQNEGEKWPEPENTLPESRQNAVQNQGK